MPEDDPREEILRHFPTMLRRWDGCLARLWELTISHASLTIRIEHHGRHGNLQIVCLEPIHIHGPREWSDCHVVVEPHGEDDFVVIDREAGVEIVTGGVEIAEHCKPYKAFTIGPEETD